MTIEPATPPTRPAGWLAGLPEDRLLVDVCLWSGDLTALGAELDRVSPTADLVHFDVTNGLFRHDLMFPPAMIAALRPRTAVPFHAHLIARHPTGLIDAVAAAGADLITVHVEANDVARALRQIRGQGKAAGLALDVDTRAVAALPHLADLQRVQAARSLLDTTGHRGAVRLLVEGGVQGRTVRSLGAAGVDGVVTDLPITSHDPAATARWLHGHRRPTVAR